MQSLVKYFFKIFFCIFFVRLFSGFCQVVLSMAVGYFFPEKSISFRRCSKIHLNPQVSLDNFARVAPLDPAFSPQLNGGGYCPGFVSVFHCIYRHSLGYQACSCYAHFMPMLCPYDVPAMCHFMGMVWTWFYCLTR